MSDRQQYAFPLPPRTNKHVMTDTECMGEHRGMTLRDYFAAKALDACFSLEHFPKIDCHNIAKNAYAVADAMIAEREKAK